MIKIKKVLKKFYFLLILIPLISTGLGWFDTWETENLIFRSVLIPFMILIIYLSLADLIENNEDISFSRLRWIGFDVFIIVLSGISIIRTVYMIMSQSNW